MALTNKLTDLADAIREQSGTTEPMTIDQMTETVKTLSPSITVGQGIGLDENGAIYTNAQIIPFADEMTVGQAIWEISDATIGAHDRINFVEERISNNEDWIRRVEEETYRLSDELNGINNVPMYNAYNPTLNGMTFTASIEGVNEEFLGFFEEELWDGILLNIFFRNEDGMAWGGVVPTAKNEIDGEIVYVATESNDAINDCRINITQHTISLTTGMEDIANAGITTIEVYYFEEQPPIKQIETRDGIWQEVNGNGRNRILGIDRSYIEEIINQKFNEFPIAEEVSV